MNFTLERLCFDQRGIFGELLDNADKTVCFTLEHAYPDGDSWAPKVPTGEYVCQRGKHQLTGMAVPFETFEIMNVTGHSGILFHTGNIDDDSSGCILVGTQTVNYSLINSRIAFATFMGLLVGINSFELLVK